MEMELLSTLVEYVELLEVFWKYKLNHLPLSLNTTYYLEIQ